MTSLKLHRWLGLLTAIWFVVVGASGLLLNYKDTRLMRQATIPEEWLPERLAETARSLLIRHWRQNRAQPERMIAAGWRGLWITESYGQHWTPARFPGGGVPLIYGLIADEDGDWRELHLASDLGVLRSEDGGLNWRPFALEGKRVTAIERAGADGKLIGVVDRNQAFELDLASNQVSWLTLARPDLAALTPDETLARVLGNLHLGSGLLPGRWTARLNDLAAIAMVALPLLGMLMWAGRLRSNTRRQIFRIHVYALGFLAAVPLIYLAITGAYYAHFSQLLPWASGISLPRADLPAASRLATWDDELSAIAGWPGYPNRLTIATRAGLLTSEDGGKTWRGEVTSRGQIRGVWGLRRAGSELHAFGARNAVCAASACRDAEFGRQMIADAALTADGATLWIGHHGAHGGETAASINAVMPSLEGVPLQYVVNNLHSFLLFAGTVNWAFTDAGAIAILMAIATGVWRWFVILRRRRAEKG